MKLNEITSSEPPMKDGMFTQKVDIAQWMERRVSDVYTIRPDLMVECHEHVDLSWHRTSREERLTQLPVQFFDCDDFSIDNNRLTTMKGFPHTVRGGFDASDNELQSLAGTPKFVQGNYIVNNNQITSLVGISELIDFIGGYFSANSMKITEGGLGLLSIKGLRGAECGGSLVSNSAFKIINKYLAAKDERDIFGCQTELIDAGLEAYAQL